MNEDLPKKFSPGDFHRDLRNCIESIAPIIRHHDLSVDAANEFDRYYAKLVFSGLSPQISKISLHHHELLPLFRKGRRRAKGSKEACVFEGPDGRPYASYHDMAYHWLEWTDGWANVSFEGFDPDYWSELFDRGFDLCVAQLDAEAAAVLKFKLPVPPIPNWNADAGELTFGTDIARTVAGQAINVRAVLNAFQQQGWPARINDPLPGTKDATRLNETVKSLNTNTRRIRFSADGSASGFQWELRKVAPPTLPF